MVNFYTSSGQIGESLLGIETQYTIRETSTTAATSSFE
jgi:hypothetical protein